MSDFAVVAFAALMILGFPALLFVWLCLIAPESDENGNIIQRECDDPYRRFEQ